MFKNHLGLFGELADLLVGERGVGAGPLQVLNLDVVDLDLLLRLDHLCLEFSKRCFQFHVRSRHYIFWKYNDIRKVLNGKKGIHFLFLKLHNVLVWVTLIRLLLKSGCHLLRKK